MITPEKSKDSSPKDVLIAAIDRLRIAMREAGYEEVPAFAIAKAIDARVGFGSFAPDAVKSLLYELPADLAFGNRCVGEVAYQFEAADDSFTGARRGYNVTIDPFGNIRSVCYLWTPERTHSEPLPDGIVGIEGIVMIENNRVTRARETYN